MRDTDYFYFATGDEHLAMARQSIASTRRADPQARIYLATERIRWQAVSDLNVNTVDVPENLPLQLAKAEAQARHILTGSYGRLTVFIDTDTLVLLPIEDRSALVREADMFVTWRSAIYVPGDPTPVATNGVVETMPYNAGVWGLRAGRVASEVVIWLRERVRLRQFSGKLNGWYADQIALAELCGPPPEGEDTIHTTPIPWLYHSHGIEVRVAKLSCDTWNYSPLGPGEDVSGRGVLHFKGAHRKLMEGYASGYA